MRSADELALFEGLRLGSERAFRRLVALHHAPMLRVAGLYAEGAAAQEELVRWTWSTALHGLGMFTWHNSFRAWLFGILAAHGRARPAIPPPPPPPPPPPARLPAADVDWEGLAWSPRWSADGWRALERALAALPLAQREVVHLRDVERWPALEADAALGVTADEGRRLLTHGRETVRAAVRTWLSLQAPPAERGQAARAGMGGAPGPAGTEADARAAREVAGVVELLGLLAPAAPADAPSAELVAVFRAWRASRRIPVWRRVRGSYLARTGGRRYAPRASAGSGGA